MEPKYLIFFAALFLGVPIAIYLAQTNRLVEKIVWVGLISFGCLGDFASINFFSSESYRGTSRGMEISLVDLCMLVLLILTIQRTGKLKLWIPGIFFYLLYFLMGIISIQNAENTIYSFCELWKMFRMLLYFITAYNYLQWREDLDTLIYTFSGVVILTFLEVMKQKYLMGVYQVRGFFPHQNSMALYMEIAGPMILALWLGIKPKHPWQRKFLCWVFILASANCMLTYSRAAMTFYPTSCAGVVFLSLFFHFTTRKLKIMFGFGFLALCGLCMILPRIIERFETAPEASKNTRINLAIAARNMANDKTFGVGINNWGIKINPPYDYSEHRIGPRYTDDFKDGIVETVYLLVAAECGWAALAIYIIWMQYYQYLALRLMLYYKKTPVFHLMLGILMGFAVVTVHSTLEWVLKQASNFYLMMLFYALIAFFRQKQLDEKRRRRAAGP